MAWVSGGGVQRLAIVAAVAAVLASGAGCGQKDDDAEIRDVVATVQRDFAAGRLEAVCDALTEAGRKHIKAMGHETAASRRRPCAQELRMLYDGIRPQEGAATREIVAVRVDGDTAVATVSDGSSHREAVPMAKEDGAWRINGLFGGIPAERQRDRF